jgi:hypothetical protein
MNKSIFCFLLSFMTTGLFGQFPEGFEGNTFPPAGWISFDNGIGPNYSWQITNDAFSGNNAAFIRWEDVADGIAEDWLVTPQFTPTESAHILSFYQSQGYAGEYYSEYTVRVSTGSQDNPADFTTIDLQYENDLELYFLLHEVDLSNYIGQSIYVAFVMSNDDGDIWRIDDVSLPSCGAPGNLYAENSTATGADLGWDESEAAAWNIEIVPYGTSPTGIPDFEGVTSNPFTWTGGEPFTPYSFYVTADCGDGSESNLSGPHTFITACGTETCDYQFILADTYGDDWNGAYIEVRQENIIIGYITQTEDGFGPFTYDLAFCPELEFSLVWRSGNWDQECVFELYDSWGQLFYSFGAGEAPENNEIFYSNVASCSEVTCRFPSDLVATDYQTNGATFSWMQNDEETLWDIQIVEHGSTPTGEPTIANVTTNPYTWTGGNAGMNYDVYVRAVCGVDDVSSWSTPASFSTLCDIAFQSFPYEENFDPIVSLPSCWVAVSHGAGEQVWGSQIDETTEDIMAICNYHYADQNEWLISPEFDFSGMPGILLSFEWKTSYYWMVYPYDKGDLNLRISLDGGNSWSAPVWSEDMAEEFPNFEMQLTELNLSAYAGQPSVLIAFQYIANDASTVYLDNFSIMETVVGMENADDPKTRVTGIYPNPGNNEVFVDFYSTEQQAVQITLVDISGKRINTSAYQANNGVNTFELDISSLSAGVYNALIETAAGIVVKKIVKF